MNSNFSDYTLSLIQIANNDKKLLKDFYLQLNELQNILKLSSEFTNFINDYTNSKSQRKKFVNAVLNELNFNKTVIYWVWIIIDNNLTINLSNIIQDFVKKYDEMTNNIKAVVYSAKELSNDQIESIKLKISQLANQTILLSNVVDKKYIAGIKLQIGTKVFDNTVSSKLQNIKNALKAKGDING